MNQKHNLHVTIICIDATLELNCHDHRAEKVKVSALGVILSLALKRELAPLRDPYDFYDSRICIPSKVTGIYRAVR